ncbi:MAG: hypothetical protein HQK58_03580 [Deltaproteobacteria bacterium]|nr:hypothetical protein [Deltaproteobacteria bacterium]
MARLSKEDLPYMDGAAAKREPCVYCIWFEWDQDMLTCLNRNSIICQIHYQEVIPGSTMIRAKAN